MKYKQLEVLFSKLLSAFSSIICSRYSLVCILLALARSRGSGRLLSSSIHVRPPSSCSSSLSLMGSTIKLTAAKILAAVAAAAEKSLAGGADSAPGRKEAIGGSGKG
jgi:hypothetical protein